MLLSFLSEPQQLTTNRNNTKERKIEGGEKEEKAYARYSLRLNFQPIIRPARNRVRVLHVVDELFEFSLQSPNDVDVFIKGGPRTRRRGCR